MRLKSLIETVQRELGEMKGPANQATNQTAPAVSQDLALPNTPAGKTLGAFLFAFNSGSLETMRKFHQEHGGDPGNAEQDMGFYNQSGGLKLHHIQSSSETEIEVLAQRKKGDEWVSFAISVDAQAPHGITDIRVKPATAPSEAGK